MEHHLHLNAALDQPGAEHLLYWLRPIPGVIEIEAAAGASQVRVHYDAALTSPREIERTATHAGFGLRQAQQQLQQQQQQPRTGGCCGACGGA
jgi:hypothetical protein